jgi:SAM-dependent methyltransferase
LASLLAECDARAASGPWPAQWGAPPTATRYVGIDAMARDVARAEQALGALPSPPQLLCADMRTAPFPACDVALLLDVLHYVAPAAQDDVLARVRAALAPGGRLLLRVGDRARRVGFVSSQWVDHAVTLARTGRLRPMWGRSLAQWHAALEGLGFRVRTLPMSHGLLFANVLLACDVARSPS